MPRGRPRKQPIVDAVDPVVESMAQREGVSIAHVMQRLDHIAAGQAAQMRALRPAKEARTPRPDDEYAAARGFGYCGVNLDRGQIFKMRGAINDELLHRLGYVTPFDRDIDDVPIRCNGCGHEFVSLGSRDAHARIRHDARERFDVPAPPERDPRETDDTYQNRLDAWGQAAGAAADADLEKQSSRDDALAPLRLDKTSASLA